jgi:hypothetical protein
MQLFDRARTALVACALLAIYCWVESARQLHQSAQPADEVPLAAFHSSSWLLMFSPEVHAQGLNGVLGGVEMHQRGLWVAAAPLPSIRDASSPTGPNSAFWGKTEAACASDPEPAECFVDLTSRNCRAR